MDRDNPSEVLTLVDKVDEDALTNWSDDKRLAFVATFDARVRVARYLLIRSAEIVETRAASRHFISDKHVDKLSSSASQRAAEIVALYDENQGKSPDGRVYYSNRGNCRIGGRTTAELDQIAEDKADEILQALPPLNQAVRIINPEIARTIEKRDKLFERGKKLLEQSQGLAGRISMEDFPDSMTLAEFKATVKAREKKRREVLEELDEVGSEGRRLDSQINKFLYAGLPGLSDAVVNVINSYVEKATAFSALNRRVAEKVQFGDSEAALDLLKGFEQDEARVAEDIKAQFDKALETLKLAGNRRKQVKAKSQE